MLHAAQQFRLVLAPMRGLTGHGFRGTFARHFGGFDSAVAPFVTAVRGKHVARSHLRDILPENNRRLACVPQVLGNDPDCFAAAARAIADLGYSEVNWNLGCPFVKVAKKKRGAGLLPHPDIVDAFLASVVPRLTIGLSVKTRLGLLESADLALLLPVLNRYPLSGITIHARLARQMYSGPVDLDTFEQCLSLSTHPVTYNGDITCVEAFHRLQERFPNVRSWMIGRGALVDPFLPSEIRGNAPAIDKPRRVHRFARELFEAYAAIMHGPGPLLGAMKELWTFLAVSLCGGDTLLKQVRKSRSVGEYSDAVDRFFAGNPAWADTRDTR